jgi:hypothetical protein
MPALLIAEQEAGTALGVIFVRNIHATDMYL